MADTKSEIEHRTPGKHPEKALSAAFARTVTAPGKYTDGHGLFLKVDPSGAKRWVQRIVMKELKTKIFPHYLDQNISEVHFTI